MIDLAQLDDAALDALVEEVGALLTAPTEECYAGEHVVPLFQRATFERGRRVQRAAFHRWPLRNLVISARNVAQVLAEEPDPGRWVPALAEDLRSAIEARRVAVQVALHDVQGTGGSA